MKFKRNNKIKGYASSCLQLKESFGILNDGDYNLNISKKIVSVNKSWIFLN